MQKFFILLLLSIPILGFSQAPVFDPTFGHLGKVQHDYSTGEVDVIDATVQLDGGCVVVIRADPFILYNYGKFYKGKGLYKVIKLDVNGKIDSSFGTWGRFEIKQPQFQYELLEILADTMDRLYLTGRYLVDTSPNEWENFAMRLDKHGQLDLTFGQQGFFHLKNEGLPDFTIDKLLLTPAGDLVLGGSMSTDKNYYLAKLSSTGQMVSSFGNNGLVKHAVPTGIPENAFITDMEIQHDSMLLICGMGGSEGLVTRFFPNGREDNSMLNKKIPFLMGLMGQGQVKELVVLPNQDFMVGGARSVLHVWKFHQNGQPDSSFSLDGFASMGDPLNALELTALTVSAMGELYMLAHSPVKEDFSVFKRKADGSTDTSFGTNGKISYQKDGMVPSQPNYLRLMSNKLMTLGECYPDICLFQLDSLGRFDSTFHDNGEHSIRLAGSGSVFKKMQIDSSGNIWAIGGYAEPISTLRTPNGVWIKHDRKPFLVKFNPLGDTLWIDFNRLDLNGQELDLVDLELGPDQHLYISGTSYDSTDTQISRPFIMKLKPNGEPDSLFHGDGVLVVRENPLNGEFRKGYDLKIQDDNKILLRFSYEDRGSDSEMGIIRYLPSGMLDTSFNSVGYVPNWRFSPNGRSLPGDLEIADDGSIFSLSLISGDLVSIPKYTSHGAWNGNIQIGTNHLRIHGAELILKPNNKSFIAFAHTFKYYVFQYNHDGRRDSSFGFEGFESISFTKGINTAGYRNEWGYLYLVGASYMPNGDILLAGHQYASDGKFSLVITRLDSNGHRKTAFAQDGKYYLEFGNKPGSMHDMHLYENGDLLVCGIIGSEAFMFRFLQDLVLPIQSELMPSSPEQPLIYPNPISQQANLKLTLSHPQEVNIELYDLQGRNLRKLYSNHLPSGEQICSLNFPPEIASGFYLVNVSTEEGESFIRIQVQ